MYTVYWGVAFFHDNFGRSGEYALANKLGYAARG
jgi:hypothetical protein